MIHFVTSIKDDVGNCVTHLPTNWTPLRLCNILNLTPLSLCDESSKSVHSEKEDVLMLAMFSLNQLGSTVALLTYLIHHATFSGTLNSL